MNRRPIGWLLLAVILLPLNFVAFRESWRLQTVPQPGYYRQGPPKAVESSECYADGRVFRVFTDTRGGIVLSRTLIQPATFWGHLETWWPAIASCLLWVSVVWFIRRNAAGRLLRMARLSPPTFAGMMILVAIAAVECSVVMAWLGSILANLDRVDWPGLMLVVLGLNILALIPIGIFLTYVEESDPSRKGPPLAPNRWIFLEPARRTWPSSKEKPRAWPELDGRDDRRRRP